MTPCEHYTTEPVILLDGEHVADLCTNCLEQLEPGYGCTDCEWCSDIALNHPVGKIRTKACRAHLETVGPA